ncbi:PAS domain S-box protein [Spirochaetia bacterium 38H-sp]|uniref:histidine kinase n=1 Tax=Rarispira pelagica TaxID=3141764 RepID=A0ABU9UBS4_9SPIR
MAKIMLVEDEALIALDIKNSLESAGHEVLLAANAKKALECTENNQDIELFILDIGLDGKLSGIELAEKIRKTKKESIIFFSNFSDNDTLNRLAKIENSIFLPKLISREILISNISLLLHTTKKKRKRTTINPISTAFAELFETMEEGVSLNQLVPDIKTPTGYKIIRVNQAFCNIIGKKKEELEGKMANEVLPSLPEHFVEKMLEVVRERKSQRFNLHLEDIDRHLSVSLIPWNMGFGAIWRDITEEIKLTEALRKSESRYRVLVENQTDMVVKVDTEGRFLYVSPSYCAVFGKSEEELLGRSFVPLVHPDDRESTLKAIENVYRPPYTAYMEQRAITKDGYRWIAWSDSAIMDEEGNIKAIIGVGRDIHDKKTAEIELNKTRKKLEETLEEKEILLKELIHRVKNTLSLILSFIHLEKASWDNKRFLSRMDSLEARIKSLSELYGLLHSTGNIKKIDVSFYIEKLVETIIKAYGMYHKIELVTKLDSIKMPAKEATSIGLIVTETVTNACKYAFEGRESGRLSIQLNKKDDLIYINIEDNGIGIQQKEGEKGEDFDQSTHGGLGLQLIPLLVQQLGGDIETSTDNTGTRICISIPGK